MDDAIVDINIHKCWSKTCVLNDKNKTSYVIQAWLININLNQ